MALGFILTPEQIIKFLEENGFRLLRHGRHRVMTNGKVSIPIPDSHSRDLAKGTAAKILKLAGLTSKDAKNWKEGK